MPDGGAFHAQDGFGRDGGGRTRFCGLLQNLIDRLGPIDLRLRLYLLRLDGEPSMEAEARLRDALGDNLDLVELAPGRFGLIAVSEANHPSCLEAKLSRALQVGIGSGGARLAVLELWSGEVVDAAWCVERLELAPQRLLSMARH